MPRFSNSLPTQREHMGYDLHRTPMDKPIKGVITCEKLYVCDTHWWGGRTIPCDRPHCPACNSSVPFRTHVYVSAFDSCSHVHYLFECTAFAAKAFEEYIRSTGTLRGCYFNAYRPKKSKNGKVVIMVKSADLTKFILPQPPNVMKALCVLWRVPYDAFDEVPTEGTKLNQHPREEIMRAMHEQQPDADGPRKIMDPVAASSNGSRKRNKS